MTDPNEAACKAVGIKRAGMEGEDLDLASADRHYPNLLAPDGAEQLRVALEKRWGLHPVEYFVILGGRRVCGCVFQATEAAGYWPPMFYPPKGVGATWQEARRAAAEKLGERE